MKKLLPSPLSRGTFFIDGIIVNIRTKNFSFQFSLSLWNCIMFTRAFIVSFPLKELNHKYILVFSKITTKIVHYASFRALKGKLFKSIRRNPCVNNWKNRRRCVLKPIYDTPPHIESLPQDAHVGFASIVAHLFPSSFPLSLTLQQRQWTSYIIDRQRMPAHEISTIAYIYKSTITLGRARF